jgi:hypothetical protein
MPGVAPSPDRIGIAIGVPSTFAEFRQRVGTSHILSKYARAGMGGAQEAALREDWSHGYEPSIGRHIVAMLEVVGPLDVRVCTGATLADISRLSSECAVLIVLTHWKGSEVTFQDLRPECDLDAIVRCARAGSTPLSNWLARRGVQHTGWWATLAGRKPPSPTALLRECIQLGWRGEATREVVDGRSALPITLAARRRDELDAMMTGLLAPGNRIELFDGLHAKEEFEAAISPRFDGFLDLTTCMSTVLGDHVSRQRGAAFRMLSFAANQNVAWHAQSVAVALEITSSGVLDYADARVEAEWLLKEAVRDEARRRRLAA